MLSRLSAAFLLSPLALAQQAAAPIDAPLVIGDYETRFQKLGDITGDGYLDAFSVWWTNSYQQSVRIYAWKNDGTGKLEKTWSKSSLVSPSGTTFWCTASGDVDTNSACDLVFAAGNVLEVIFSQVGGAASMPGGCAWTTGGGAPIRGLALVNVDGDAGREIAVAHGKITVLDVQGVPNGPLVVVDQMDLGLVNGELQAVDVNSDGQRDLLVWDATRVLLVPIVGGQMQTPTIFDHTRTDPRGAGGDLDGDGDEDIVIFDAGTYELWRRTGVNSWSHEGPFNGGPARYLSDLDGDGDLDGVCCGGGGGPTTMRNNSTSFFRIALNNGEGYFAPAIEFPGLGSERLAGAGDLDHDGDLDLVAGRCVYYAPAQFKYGIPRKIGTSAPIADQCQDLDGDGDPDLAQYGGGLRNDGNGNYASYTPVLPAPAPNDSYQGQGYCGDFDGDGDADLVVGLNHFLQFQNMQLLTNLGGGAFVDAGPAAAPGLALGGYTVPQPGQALVADADGDGDLDLAVREQSFATHFYWNDGQGFFSDGPLVDKLLVRRIVDLNLDGLPDLVGWYRWSEQSIGKDLARVPGLGSGTFGVPAYFGESTNGDPWSIVIGAGDAEGDGDVDLVVSGSSGIRLFENPGVPGPWPQGILLASDQHDSSVTTVFGAAFADVNMDGRLDVLGYPVGYYTLDQPNASRVLLRKLDNSGYYAPFSQLVQPTDALDVDGDGDQDLLATCVYKSRGYEAPNAGLRRQVSSGQSGTGGLLPTLGARGPFRYGANCELRLRGARGGASGWVLRTIVADNPPSFTGGVLPARLQLQVDPIAFTTSGSPGTAGTGCWSHSFPAQLEDVGRTVRYRAIVADPNAFGGWARTNDLLLTFGL